MVREVVLYIEGRVGGGRVEDYSSYGRFVFHVKGIFSLQVSSVAVWDKDRWTFCRQKVVLNVDPADRGLYIYP